MEPPDAPYDSASPSGGCVMRRPERSPVNHLRDDRARVEGGLLLDPIAPATQAE